MDRRELSISANVPPQNKSSTKSSRNSISKTTGVTGASSSPKNEEDVPSPKTPIPNSPPPSNKLPQPYLLACTDVCRSTPVGRGVATILPRPHDSGTRTSHPNKT